MRKNFNTLFIVFLCLFVLISGFYLVLYKTDWKILDLNFSKKPTIPLGKESPGTMKKFSNLDELQKFFQENITSSLGYDGITIKGAPQIAPVPTMAESGSTALDLWGGEATTVSKNLAVPLAERDYSLTNVQVENVDEADIVKTDGQYIYAVSGQTIFIINAYPAQQAQIISQIQLKSTPQDIYINGNSLVVFGYDDRIFAEPIYQTFRRQSSYTYLKVFDISDKKTPKQVRDLDFEGSYVSSRLIGDYVYFITNNYLSYFGKEEPPVPHILENGKALCVDNSNTGCLFPDIYYFDFPYQNYSFINVTAININNNEEKINSQILLLDSTQNIYVSQKNIYLTFTKYYNEELIIAKLLREILFDRLSEKTKNKILNIENASTDVLNEEEKLNKISQILQSYVQISLTQQEQEQLFKEIRTKITANSSEYLKQLENTNIYKISIDKNALNFEASGQVTGHVLNQFSMDEQDNYFRIATTKSRVWSQYIQDENLLNSSNNLYVLDENLKPVGALENLESNEQIYSVRFMQNRAYMVTYRQVDPLLVIDLSNPKTPRVLGQLKVPGYSSYLHPYDEKTLIGLGKETEVNEWGGVTNVGLKLSLFDVSDVANPKEISKYVFEDKTSDSIALYDHKAFLFSKEKNLLVIPVTSYNYQAYNPWGYNDFRGAAIFSIDKQKGIALRGKINHYDGQQEINPIRPYFWEGQYYQTAIKRSLYIENMLYTLSDKYLKANELTDLTEIKSLNLMQEEDYKIIN